jgi:MFS family permease
MPPPRTITVTKKTPIKTVARKPTIEEPEYKKKEKSVRLSYTNAFFSAIKEGIHTQFMVPFALALRAGSEHIAIIATAPQLIGSFFQLFASDLLNLMHKRKKVIVFTAMIDALLWIPILLIPFLWQSDIFLLINFLIIQAIANYLLNPFYNSLLGDIIPQEKRGRVIGRINQISGMLTFMSSLVAGLILSVFRERNPFIGFAIIFFIAFLARMASVFVKSRIYEPSAETGQNAESILSFSRNIRKSNFGQFVMYASWMKFAVGLSAPFFAVYMLTYLNLDFLTYSLINGGAIISSFLVLNKWGRDIDKNGSRWMLGITGFLVPITPVLWILFQRPLILFIVELFSGAVWAGYNLSTANFVMDATNSKNRLLKTSYYNFFLGVAIFAGAMLGGQLLKHLPSDFMGNIFFFIFGLSAAVRLLASIYFIRKIKEERFVGIELKGPQAKMVVSVLPKQGAMFEYVPRKRK